MALGGEFSSGIEKERKKTYMRVVSELAFKWSPLESEHVQVSDSEGVTKSSGRSH